MSVYEEIGGAESVKVAVDVFYGKVLGDERLAPFFASTDVGHLKAHQRAFITAALGGPEGYTGRGMAEAHAGRGIRSEHFDAVVGHLVATLEELSVPAETIGAIGASLLPLKAEIAEDVVV